MCSIFISDKLSHICQLQSYVFFQMRQIILGKLLDVPGKKGKFAVKSKR